MKETKKFFDTNRLNKGYSKVSVYKQTDVSAIGNQYKHVLPPMDIMAEYEELNPGTIEKILHMAGKEQNHRHKLESLAIEQSEKATELGRKFSIILVTIIAIAAIILAFDGHYIVASLFSIAGFGAVGVGSFINSCKMPVRKTFTKNFDPKYRNPNYKGKKKY